MLSEVIGHIAPYDYCHDRYQAYYSAGIRQYVEQRGGRFSTVSLTRFAALQRRLRRVRSSHRLNRVLPSRSVFFHGLDGLARVLCGAPADGFHSLVGRYLFRFDDGSEGKVCIDAADSGAVASNELLDWCDLYFKTNYWAAREYAAKVVPFYNGNPLVLSKREELRELRFKENRYDLCFIVRVWGGANEVEGIEHNIRLLEAVNRVDCRKFVRAYLVAGDIDRYAGRLSAQNIACTTEPMPLADLWSISAQSRLNVIRLGMHGCLPWRMTDLLAVGACPVLDQVPNTTWQPAFVENENFLSLDAATEAGCLATESAYEGIPARLERFLASDSAIETIQARNAAYFDECVCPESIGRQICETVLARFRPAS